MCGNCFRIKVCNRFAPNKVAVKCGICKECRQIERNSWAFRLRCELEDCHNKGWKIGFLTLTYDDDNLPRIPLDLADLSKTRLSVGPSCFNRSQVKDFIISLRKKLYDDYGIGKNKDGIKYLVASEYGKSTARPHYHMVISWPSYDDLDASKMLDIIRSKWSYGFIFPKDYRGGYDSHHYYHQPFEVTSNPYACAKYISKYICKDLDFFDSLSDFYPSEGADLSNYFPFHIQSKSLGFSRFVCLTDDDKLKIVRDGYSFIGEDTLVPIPLYLKRKIFFSPLYIYERKVFQGSRQVTLNPIEELYSDSQLQSLGFRVEVHRLVRRKATDFFKKNYEYIYEKQHQTYTKLFERVFNKEYLVSHGVSNSVATDFLHWISNCSISSPSHLAQAYLTYYGLPIDKCFDIEPSFQWYLRYDTENEVDVSSLGFFRISADYYDEVKSIVPLALELSIACKFTESQQEKLAALVADFWKSAI